MEPHRAGGLTAQEEAQLKEKLALLKREYSKTFQRLQRAERAEKIESSVKKTVEEQNLLLTQEIAEEDCTGSISQMSSKTLKYVPVGICSEKSTVKTASVIFEPEVVGQGCSLPKNSGFKSTSHVCQRGLCSLAGPVPEQNQNLSSKRKTCQKATVEEREFVCEALQRTAECQLEHDMDSVKNSRSPVFKRKSFILETDHSIPKIAVAYFERRGGNTSAMPQLEPSEELYGETVFPEVSHPRSCVRVSSLGHLCDEGIVAAFEGLTAENALSHADMWNEGKESAQKGEEQTGIDKEDPGRREDLAVTSEAFQGGRAAPCMHGDEMHRERNQCKEAWNLDLVKKGSSTNKPSEKDLGDHLNPASPTKSALGSCTVVEGLLFPVEYYVRTTRRLSSCQREVNLEAVIQSQLGKSRKGLRTTRKEKNAKPATLSQEHVESDEQLRAVSFSPLGAGGAFDTLQSLPLSQESAASTMGLSQSEGLLQRRRGRLRGGSNHRASSDVSQKLTVSKAQGRKRNCQGRGKAMALPANTGGNMGAKQSGWKRSGDSVAECLKADLETAQNFHVNLVTESASSSVRGLEENYEVSPSESKPLGQAGNWNHTNAKLGQLVQAALPQCEPPVASLEGAEKGPSQGRRVGSLCGKHEDPFLGLLRTSSAAFHLRNHETSNLKRLPPSLDLREFHLPEDEFGLLKLEKLKLCAAKPLETFNAGEPANCLQCVGDLSATGKTHSLLPGAKEPSMPPPFPQSLQKKGVSSSKLLLSPTLEDVHSLLESQQPTPIFPIVGPTPASQALRHSEALPDVYPLQVNADTIDELGSSVDASLQEAQDQSGTLKSEEKLVSREEGHVPAGESIEHCSKAPKQNEMVVKDVEQALENSWRRKSLQMTSKLKSCSGSCSVDVSTVWWEAADFMELCIATACKTSVSLWRPLDAGRWRAVYTWHFAKVPVTHMIPLPGVHSLVCVALGGLEVAEIRFLFHSSQDDCVKQLLVKAGNIKAVLGLKNRRLVSSCGSLQGQDVEVMSFSETGRSNERWALMPPEETILAFAEVEGMEEALVGMTALNCVVIWNLRTGQLLRKMSVGYSYPACVCHKVYSDLGLLFVVLSHPHAKENETCGSPAFQIVALNPKTARNTGVTFLSLPPGIRGRYLEGEVRNASAVAVLTSGTIAVWDLFLGQCTALLPPNSAGSWSLVKWSITGACLLAGQKDGSVYIYSYTACLSST